MTQENIIIYEDIRYTKDIPEIEGYRIVENHFLDAFFSTLNSHSTDLYTVCLFDGIKKITPLMYGALVGSNSKLTADEADHKYRDEIRREVYAFASTAKDLVISNRVTMTTIGKITIMSARCNKGYIIAAWLNNNGDTDISKQMLAYTMLNFAGLNTSSDDTLKQHVYDTIPTDSRFGTFNAKDAKSLFLAELYSRPERMKRRLQGRGQNMFFIHHKPRLS